LHISLESFGQRGVWMKVELKSADALSASEREAWQAFATQNPQNASPYFGLRFLDAIASVRSDTRVLCVSHKGAPHAFLPMQLSAGGFARELGGPLGDHAALICDPQTHFDLADALHDVGIGLFSFEGARADQSVFHQQICQRQGSWVMDLSAGYEAYQEAGRSISAKKIAKLRARRRKAEALSPVFRIHDQRGIVFEQAIRWKREQYVHAGYFDAFSVDWTRDLLTNLVQSNGEREGGIVSSLELDGELAAVHVGMRSQSVLHYWFPAYNPKFSKLAPGLTLLLELARTLSEDGITAIDLGPGEYQYKAELAGLQTPILSGFAGKGLAMALRQLTHAVEQGAEQLPLGRVSHWPGKARRRFRRMSEFNVA
jgi:CelD/BcsL family acetyltransferase involved in cellulose biosynthesis